MNVTRTAAVLLAASAAALLAGCAAVLASNEPLRNDLIPQVQHGMTQDQVRVVMGPPDQVMAFERSQTVAWDYRFTDSWGFLSVFAVTFSTADGRVASTTTWRLNDGRSGSGMN